MGLNQNLLTKQEVYSILEDVLKKEDLQDAEIEISSGSNKGDGFLSCMNKVMVKSENKKLHLILKCAPKSQEFRNLVPLNLLYSREARFYEKIYPKLMEFQEEKRIKKPFRNIPKCYKTVSDEFGETIVLANIKDGEGFDVFDKRVQMDHEHVVRVLEVYGKFHAISFAMKEYNKELYDELTEDLWDVFHKFDEHLFSEFDAQIQRAKDIFKTEDENYIIEALEKIQGTSFEFFTDMGKTRADYDIINHGDCWCNNMMFKYEKGTRKIADIKLIDFQICRAGSPVMDLCYFLYVSSSRDIYNNLDHYLNIYYQSLGDRLKEFGCELEKIYPFTALKADWKKYSRFGYLMALSLIKAVLMEGNEVVDIADIAEGRVELSNFYKAGFKNEELANQRIKDLTIHMVNNKFI